MLLRGCNQRLCEEHTRSISARKSSFQRRRHEIKHSLLVQEMHLFLRGMHVDIEIICGHIQRQKHPWMRVFRQVRRVYGFDCFADRGAGHEPVVDEEDEGELLGMVVGIGCETFD